MLYRPYLPEDFAALYAVEEICFEPPFRFDVEFMLQLVQSPNTATWIAEQDNQMAGFAIVEWTDKRNGREGYIQTIEVMPSARGRGVGEELLWRIEASAHAANCKIIWLHVDADNIGAIHLYSTCGYVYEGRAENYYARRRTALIYLKILEGAPAG